MAIFNSYVGLPEGTVFYIETGLGIKWDTSLADGSASQDKTLRKPCWNLLRVRACTPPMPSTRLGGVLVAKPRGILDVILRVKDEPLRISCHVF
jgi:hypothetical protein